MSFLVEQSNYHPNYHVINQQPLINHQPYSNPGIHPGSYPPGPDYSRTSPLPLMQPIPVPGSYPSSSAASVSGYVTAAIGPESQPNYYSSVPVARVPTEAYSDNRSTSYLPQHYPNVQGTPQNPSLNPPLTMAKLLEKHQALLNYALRLSNSILKPEVVIEEDYEIRNPSFIYAPTSYNFFGGNTYYGGNGNNGTQRAIVGVVATLVLMKLCELAGNLVGKVEKFTRKNRYFRSIKKQWNDDNAFYRAQDRKSVNKLIKRIDKIESNRKTNAIQNLVLVLLGIIAAGGALGGALVGSSSAMALGVGGGIALGGIAIAKYAYRCSSQWEASVAKKIEICLKNLQPSH